MDIYSIQQLLELRMITFKSNQEWSCQVMAKLGDTHDETLSEAQRTKNWVFFAAWIHIILTPATTANINILWTYIFLLHQVSKALPSEQVISLLTKSSNDRTWVKRWNYETRLTSRDGGSCKKQNALRRRQNDRGPLLCRTSSLALFALPSY